MESCKEVCKKPKRMFVQNWLKDDRYKDWIRPVPHNKSQYHCTICNKDFSCNAAHISRHNKSACHRKNLSPCRDNVITPSIEKKTTFRYAWLDKNSFRFWLREVPDDPSICYCKICEKTFVARLSQIRRHEVSQIHLSMCKRRGIEVNELYNDDTKDENLWRLTQDIGDKLAFDIHKKIAEIQFAACVVQNDIPFQTAAQILRFFQAIGQNPIVLNNMNVEWLLGNHSLTQNTE